MSVWSEETQVRAKEIISRYPEKRSAVMPLLYLAMAEDGYLTDEGMEEVSHWVGITPAQVRSVASFYTMYKREKTGRYLVSCCTSISCMLLGGDDILDAFFEWGPVSDFFKKAGKGLFGEAAGLAGNLAIEAMGKLGLSPGAAAKRAANALAGLIVSAVQGNPTLSLKVGGGVVPEVGVQFGGDATAGSGEVYGVPVTATSGNMPTNERIDVLR